MNAEKEEWEMDRIFRDRNFSLYSVRSILSALSVSFQMRWGGKP
jgi:hypothetical protein